MSYMGDLQAHQAAHPKLPRWMSAAPTRNYDDLLQATFFGGVGGFFGGLVLAGILDFFWVDGFGMWSPEKVNNNAPGEFWAYIVFVSIIIGVFLVWLIMYGGPKYLFKPVDYLSADHRNLHKEYVSYSKEKQDAVRNAYTAAMMSLGQQFYDAQELFHSLSTLHDEKEALLQVETVHPAYSEAQHDVEALRSEIQALKRSNELK